MNTGRNVQYLMSRILLIRMTVKFGLNVRLNSCGKGLHIIHLGHVFTNGDIGENFTLYPNVMIGAEKGECPVLGNFVTVFTGATIVGGIRIANGVRIGANALVNKSFLEEGITVGGVPAKKLINTRNN